MRIGTNHGSLSDRILSRYGDTPLGMVESALEFLAEVGFDPEFGARPMRRAIQEKLENRLAELLLGGKLRRKDTVVIGERGDIRVEN